MRWSGYFFCSYFYGSADRAAILEVVLVGMISEPIGNLKSCSSTGWLSLCKYLNMVNWKDEAKSVAHTLERKTKE
jgi:hypothetical protein